jgi:hypothetical protein
MIDADVDSQRLDTFAQQCLQFRAQRGFIERVEHLTFGANAFTGLDS